MRLGHVDKGRVLLLAVNRDNGLESVALSCVRREMASRFEGGDTETSAISADMLPKEIGEMLPNVSGQDDNHVMTLPLREARELFEREYLVAQINRFGGNISKTAEFVGMERSALHRKLKTLGLVIKHILAKDLIGALILTI